MEETESESHVGTKKVESASWVHFDNLKGGKQLNTYDPFSRNPLYCGAENTSLWELKSYLSIFILLWPFCKDHSSGKLY